MFQFKQFAIEDNRCAHKVGTDGTLLGAWAKVEKAKNILDVGTGSGLIALMLAQRSDATAHIDAIDIVATDCSQASDNVKHSPWSRKVSVHHTSLQEFDPSKKFDCIITNPPFFNNSFKPPVQSRITPRHTDTLPFEELVYHSKGLLTHDGRLNVILPYTEGLKFIGLANSNDFHLTRQWSFRTRQEKAIARLLLEFSNTPTPLEKGEILLYEKDDDWSESYRILTKDFYLKL
jgi:tRNA1Val (adenine37-N6)-methyltransferase